MRSVLAVPLAAIFWPAMQFVQSAQANVLAEVEYLPDAQLLHTRLEVLVPLAETY